MVDGFCHVLGDTQRVSIDVRTQHSADKAWWWDGTQWVPAWTSDGRYWFDGRYWRHLRRRLTRAEWFVFAAWIGLWVLAVAWAIWAVQAAGDAENVTMPTPMLITGLTLLALVVVGIPTTSGWLAARRRWTRVLVFAAAVTCLLLAWYVAAMLVVPVPVGQPDIQDDAAGAGLVYLALPTAAAVLVLTGIGASIGVIADRVVGGR